MDLFISQNDIALAAQYLLAGEVIGIPTETVYGLAADITNESAVKNIFKLKGRPLSHPLIVHIADINDLSRYALNIPPYAYQLAHLFWPGPLTMVFQKSNEVGHWVTGNQETVALRMPNHPLALALIKQVGKPLAAPSANRFGRISPTIAEHVIQEFNAAIKVLDGGPCGVGIESTIIDATKADECRVLRPGMITLQELKKAINTKIVDKNHNETGPKVSGSLKSHYAPLKPTWVFKNMPEYDSMRQNFSGSCYLLYLSEAFKNKEEQSLRMPSLPKEYAKSLYHALRQADDSNKDMIAIELPPESGEWVGILDRLQKSSYTTHSQLFSKVL